MQVDPELVSIDSIVLYVVMQHYVINSLKAMYSYIYAT